MIIASYIHKIVTSTVPPRPLGPQGGPRPAMATLPAFAAPVAPGTSSSVPPAGARATSTAGRGRWRGWLGLSHGFSSDLGGARAKPLSS